jgi:hypothetical protein
VARTKLQMERAKAKRDRLVPPPGQSRRPAQFVLNKNTLLISGPFIDVDRYEADRYYLISSDRAQLTDVADELRASYG